MLSPQSVNLKNQIELLNEVQKQAAIHHKGPLVVFAGAGSGKTRIITHRIALLLENGIQPSQILAVTFTNKAAKEMRERVVQLSPDGRFCHIGTFHSSCARWLREFAPELGFTSDFTIYDENDVKSLIKKILKESNISADDVSPGEYRHAISQAKTRGWLPHDAINLKSESEQFFPKGGLEVYQKYQEALSFANAMDFNDLLLNMLLLLKNNKKIKGILQDRYKFILVDEYQDTNPTQFSLISLLADGHQNLFVVGDDDQSIYSWRGANPSNIIEFTKIYPNAKEIRLEQNYRCTGNIVKAANNLIQHNKHRSEKKLWTDNTPGPAIDFHVELDGDLEAFHIIDQINEEKSAFNLDEVAIFYRTNAQSRVLEDNLRRARIPYQIFGALRFYDRAEIKDMLAYFRLLTNENDDVALRRIINVPTRGIGQKALELVSQKALVEGRSLFAMLKIMAKQELPRLSTKLEKFAEIMNNIKAKISTSNLEESLSIILKETAYQDYLRKKFPDQESDKLSNIHELAVAITTYFQEKPNSSLINWLNDISLSGSEEENEGGVTLMTLHSAKGLEFNRVYIAGFEDGLTPHSNSMEDSSQLEEERRLIYVGITRAKEKLSLVSARKRKVFNNWVANQPSRFLNELPEDVMHYDHTSKEYQPKPKNEQRKTHHHSEQSCFPGQKVLHPVYGKGIVEEVEDLYDLNRIVVRFNQIGKRKVLADTLEKEELTYDYSDK